MLNLSAGKTCNRCGVHKPYSEFQRHAVAPDGRGYTCLVCAREYNKKRKAELLKKHPEYSVWLGIRNRCNYPSMQAYKWYGAKGIKVCERWKKFKNFLADMGERPDGAVIDRIDPDGDYSPENCRWVSRKASSRNRTNTRWVEFNGETKCLTDWAESCGLSPHVVYTRIANGWSVEDALTRPVIKKSTNKVIAEERLI